MIYGIAAQLVCWIRKDFLIGDALNGGILLLRTYNLTVATRKMNLVPQNKK